MEQEVSFEALLKKHRIVVERYINFRLPSSFDADDVIQETYYAAYVGYEKLRNKEWFKSWILAIARNQCNLWFRKKYGSEWISIDAIPEIAEADAAEDDDAQRILSLIPRESAELLKLTMQGYKQKDIAKRFDIPIGTVKSRLHYARKQFRSMCTPDQILMFEKGRRLMAKKDYTCGFPANMPTLIIKESPRPFFEVKCADESFIVPVIGNKNSEGTYRCGKLALVSTCYVPKAAMIHEVAGVKVCRDTYNIKAGKLYKNEKIWFTQLTDEYVRDLATIDCDGNEDNDLPTSIYTFLEEDYDVIVNGNDRVHGRPLLIKENPPKMVDGKIYIDEYNIRYTMGTFDVTIGERTFETIKFIRVQNNTNVTENYVDAKGRLVFMRWYESADWIEQTEWYTDELKQSTVNSPKLIVNGIEYRLVEDRISEYAL
ncbi:MAG: RNA polymerase sigma factor [Clostridia bacterium]|nr:RNA polymerase sigma factor [Clostridia bacterium]MBO5295620.1 RNA polymerase sigma factor [Clostridia bacterium]